MVLQAGALGVSAPDDDTRQAAEELRAAGCQALDELRDLVGILRTAPGDDELPSGQGLAELVAESTAVGTPAELDEHGDPALASPVVSRTLYRIVREALTNVRKHAPGARTVVQITYGSSQIKVTVRNGPRGGTAINGSLGGDLASTGSGLGIASLRQRTELVGGTLLAEPTPDGGFCLAATLPSFVPTAQPVA
jgi:signal transduction histidine kinase